MIEQVRAYVADRLEELDGVVALRRTSEGTAPYLFREGDDLSQLVLDPRYPLASVRDILAAAEHGSRPHFLLLLDNILDPQNLGAIVRTALCVGVDGVIMPKDRSAAITPAVSKASAGALEHILLSRVTNLVQAIKLCKEHGVWVVGLDKTAERTLYDGEMTGPIAIVLGGELKGLRPLVKKNCDFLVSIPQHGAVDSLNASVAAAVTMYEALRQRQKK